MSSKSKLLKKLGSRAADKNWTLTEAELVLTHSGFVRRAGKGSHINYAHPDLADVLTLSCHGNQVKPCYIKMIRQAIDDLP